MSAFKPVRLACVAAAGVALLTLSGCYYYPPYYGGYGGGYTYSPYPSVPASATQREQPVNTAQAAAPDDDQYGQPYTDTAAPPPQPAYPVAYPAYPAYPAWGWYGWGAPAFSLNFGFGGRGRWR